MVFDNLDLRLHLFSRVLRFPGLKVLADEIQSLEEFQAATEKTRNLILAAFNDMRASMPPEECLETRVDTAEPEETSQGPEEGRVEVESQMDR